MVAPGVDADALNVFHDDVWAAVVGGATVEEACDVGVVEGSYDLAFATEALDDSVGFDALVDYFNRYELVVGFVGA